MRPGPGRWQSGREPPGGRVWPFIASPVRRAGLCLGAVVAPRLVVTRDALRDGTHLIG